MAEHQLHRRSNLLNFTDALGALGAGILGSPSRTVGRPGPGIGPGLLGFQKALQDGRELQSKTDFRNIQLGFQQKAENREQEAHQIKVTASETNTKRVAAMQAMWAPLLKLSAKEAGFGSVPGLFLQLKTAVQAGNSKQLMQILEAHNKNASKEDIALARDKVTKLVADNIIKQQNVKLGADASEGNLDRAAREKTAKRSEEGLGERAKLSRALRRKLTGDEIRSQENRTKWGITSAQLMAGERNASAETLAAAASVDKELNRALTRNQALLNNAHLDKTQQTKIRAEMAANDLKYKNALEVALANNVTTENVNSIRAQYQGLSKDFIDAEMAFQKVEAAGALKTPTGDLAMMVGFFKLIDPGSVVKETEVLTVENARKFGDKWTAFWNKMIWTGNKLTDTQRTQILAASKSQLIPYQHHQRILRNTYNGIADRLKIDRRDIVAGTGDSVLPGPTVPQKTSTPNNRVYSKEGVLR